jgi:hypothetical protein
MSKVKTSSSQISEAAQVMLNETVDWTGRFISAYAKLQEALRNRDEDAFDQAWGDLTSALLLLRDKADQAHDLLDED